MGYSGSGVVGSGPNRCVGCQKLISALGFGLRCGSVIPRFLLGGRSDGLYVDMARKHWDDGAAISTALMACWGVAGVVGGVCGC
jgi:hypothetical protein